MDNSDNGSKIYNSGDSESLNFGNIEPIPKNNENNINHINLEPNKKEKFKLNEPEKDNFIRSLTKIFEKIYKQSNFLLNSKDKIVFPILKENSIDFEIQFLKDINSIYIKNKKDKFETKLINTKLQDSLLQIIKDGDYTANDFIDILSDDSFQPQKYNPNIKENTKPNSKKDSLYHKNFSDKIKSGLKNISDNFIEVKRFLLKECKFSERNFDDRGDFLIPNLSNNIKRGSEIYYPPYMWIGIGLNVCAYKKYEKDGNWLFKDYENSQWTNAYLGFCPENNDIKTILHDLPFNIEKLEKYEKENDFLDTKHWKKRFGKGIYLNNKIENAEKDSWIININKKKFKVLFMVRVKISEICQPENEDVWALDKKYIRIYRILFKEIIN